MSGDQELTSLTPHLPHTCFVDDDDDCSNLLIVSSIVNTNAGRMALVLRSSSDLVYLPDHGFVGEEGGKSCLKSCCLVGS
jgi:hypothetical protein